MPENKQIQTAQPTRRLTNIELGQIMLREVGEEACQKGYGTVDPECVGRYARSYNDINPDGTLN